jgi:CHAT domain-containing protein
MVDNDDLPLKTIKMIDNMNYRVIHLQTHMMLLIQARYHAIITATTVS